MPRAAGHFAGLEPAAAAREGRARVAVAWFEHRVEGVRFIADAFGVTIDHASVAWDSPDSDPPAHDGKAPTAPPPLLDARQPRGRLAGRRDEPAAPRADLPPGVHASSSARIGLRAYRAMDQLLAGSAPAFSARA